MPGENEGTGAHSEEAGHYLCGHFEGDMFFPLKTGQRIGSSDFLQITMLRTHCNSLGQFHEVTSPGLGTHTGHVLVDHYLWAAGSGLGGVFALVDWSADGIYVTLRDQEKGKETVYLLRQCILSFLTSFSFTGLVGWLFNAFGYWQKHDHNPTAPDGMYCVCLNLHPCLKAHPRVCA